jgi:hypothetical protein
MHDYGRYCSLSWSLPVFCEPSFCTEYELYSCIQLPETKLFQCVHHTYLLAIFYSKVHLTCFYLSFKLNSFSFMWKLVSKARTNLMAHFTFLAFKILTLWLFYIDVMLASCKLEISQTMPSWGKLFNIALLLFDLISWSFVYGYSQCEISWESCGIMEFVYVLEKCLGR